MALHVELEKAFRHAGIDATLFPVGIRATDDELVHLSTYEFTVPAGWTFKEPTPAVPEAGTAADPKTEPANAPV